MIAINEKLFDILKYPDLAKYTPMRIILKKDDEGNYQGYCEESFSMGWYKDRVQIHWSGKAYSNFGTTHDLDATKVTTPSEGCEILDPLADDCPIEIDWGRWLTATSKFERRNAKFKLKERKENECN
ncbi:MAG TPA: hypothetical protein VFM18_19395 [Methanosarcina sp.]|nr:hypothetical protein [Methanosarcina sp.]